MGKVWRPRQKDMQSVEEKLPPGDPLTAAYLNGRREWDERVGDAVAREHGWKIAFFSMLVVLAGSVTGNVYQGTQSKIVPYVVERDRNADVVAVRAADRATAPDEAHIKAALARWLTNNRTIYTDVNALKKAINEAYALTASGSAAFTQLSLHYQQNDPFERAKRSTVAVSNLTGMPLSEPDVEGRTTWRLEWIETETGRDGTPIRREPWNAIITFKVTLPSTAEEVVKNPDGIFVVNYSWTART